MYAGALVIVMSIAKPVVRKLREKRNVFKRRLNICNDGDDVTCAGAVRSRPANKSIETLKEILSVDMRVLIDHENSISLQAKGG